MAIRLSEREAEALRGCHHLDQVLYVFGLRRHMDYATGIVGESRRISVQSLKEAAYVEPSNGPVREKGAPTKHRILRSIDRLADKGLVEREGTFVFRLPLADCDEVRSEKLRTYCAPDSATDSAPDSAPRQASHDAVFSESSAPDSAPDSAPTEDDIPHHLRGPGNSVPKGTGTDVPESSAARTWRLWLELVGDTRANRAVLGRIIKDHGEEEVAEGVATTWAKNPADPVSYLRGCLKPKRRFVC